jgi:hypothetical protein
VDDQYAPLADKIQEALRGITDKPVRFIVESCRQCLHAAGLIVGIVS